jgi:hypothetical protein
MSSELTVKGLLIVFAVSGAFHVLWAFTVTKPKKKVKAIKNLFIDFIINI